MSWKGPYKWIFKRDHKIHRFQLTDKNGPYDLTNVTEIIFTVREDDTEGASIVYSCTMTGTDIERKIPYTDGKIDVKVEPTDTSTKTAGKKVYDIQVTDASSEDHTFGKGSYEIVQDASYS